VLPHWVAGDEYEGTGGRSAEVTDPATGTTTVRLSLAAPADVDAAVAAAKAAFPAWRDTSLARRAGCCSGSASCSMPALVSWPS
jgi:malonate-semialdehyde dehydrogenase (acetylating)/methylmalonate-semialdehyde dehydrogenase